MSVFDAITTDQYAGQGGSYTYNEGTGTRTPVIVSSPAGPAIIRDRNQLLRINPTRVGIPYNRDNSAATTNTVVRDSAVMAFDNDKVSPIDGLSTVKLTIPASVSSYQELQWDGVTQFSMNDNDVWIIAFYCSRVGTVGVNVQLMISNLPGTIGTEYRLYSFPSGMIREGWNILTAMHHEVHIAAAAYGTVGTTTFGAWQDSGSVTKASSIQTVRLRIRTQTPDASPFDCWIGGVYRAPSGWAKSAIVIGADDAPRSILDHIIPMVESYGWRMVLNITSQYATDPQGTYISIDEVRDLESRGHEIWGHMRRHENMVTSTDAEKNRALRASRDFWLSRGMPNTAKYAAWPFGQYDSTSVTKAKNEGYKLVRAVNDGWANPLVPAINPYHLRSFDAETNNSWHVDAMMNGACLSGRSFWMHMHNAIPGGAGINTFPGVTQFYVEHMRRWLDLAKSHEQAGRAVVVTGLEYFDLCGVNPATDTFIE